MDAGVHEHCKRRPMCDQLCPMCTPWQPLTREECDKMQADLVEQMKRAVREPYYGKHIILPLPKEGFTEGHCEHRKSPGGCQLHNLQCGYPDCDRRGRKHE